jgi:excisionase family DNA binding protein
MSQREVWTYADLAKAYSISTRTLRRLVARGELRAVRIGGAVRITEESRAAWAASLPLRAAPAPAEPNAEQAAA